MGGKREKGEMAQMGMFIDGVIDAMPVYVKELVAGGVAGGMAKSVVAPLERIKILFQVQLGWTFSLVLFSLSFLVLLYLGFWVSYFSCFVLYISFIFDGLL